MPRRTTTREVTPATAPPEQFTVSPLRPGYLVGLKTSVTGNVKYDKEIIEAEYKTRSGAQRASWKMERVIDDPEEHVKANQARMKARALISAVCAKSAFGLLCPENRKEDLRVAIAEARKTVASFNRRSRITTVRVDVLMGEVVQSDREAVRAIKGEVRDLLQNMSEGVRTLDVKKVREAANKARELGAMLTEEASTQIKAAIDVARGAARKIAKAGEAAAGEIDREAIRKIGQTRTAFLEINGDEGDIEVQQEAAPAVEFDPTTVPDGAFTPPEPVARKRVKKPTKEVKKPITSKRKRVAVEMAV